MNAPTNQSLPLAGLLVLDFAQFLAGPSAAMRLSDLGAEVIKVERPQGGDLCRGLVVADQRVGEDSALFHTINRGKQSFAADLKDTDDLARVKALVARADVLIHNFRPGVMDRIGLDYDTVAQLNPRLVYAVVSGYGEAGPWRDKPGQDLLVQSLSGLAWLTGDGGKDAPPVPTGVSVIDVLTGAHLVQGILAALLRRGVSGQGGRVDVSLLESALDLQFEPFTAFLNSDRTQPERSVENHANVHTAAPYGIYRTADGFMAIAMAPLDLLAERLACPTLADRASDASRWFTERDAIKKVLQAHLLTDSTATWLAALEPAGIWCADVLTWPQLIAHPGFAALDMVQTIDAAGQPMATTRCPIRIDGQRLKDTRGAPALGADTDRIVRRFGLSAATFSTPEHTA